MYQGKVIKFYREKFKFTQEQLGQGICSATHVSKIERGLTEYSSEITELLAKRLEINMDKELSNISTIKSKLDLWHDMIMAQDTLSSSAIEAELDINPLVAVSEYKTLFYLIKLQHHIKLGNSHQSEKLFRYLPKEVNQLANIEQNLYKHVLGNYNMLISNYSTALHLLEEIDFSIYSTPMAYYDLASAYHHNKSPVLAYYYGDMALDLFKKQNNFLGIIDTENLMLIQLESDYHRNFNETTEQYENLLSLCDLVHAHDKKAKVYHNYAYENLRQQQYDDARALYIKSMNLKEKDSGVYLLSLEGFIRCETKDLTLPKETLLDYIDEGLAIAKKIEDTLYSMILTLHKYYILEKTKEYYHFLADKALPFFKANGYIMISQRYEKELFTYYIDNNQTEAALNLSISMINHLED